MALWEKFLAGDSIPKYVQVFFLHDFNWKLRADLLWPYQYDDEEFEKARNRIFALLKKIDDDVIIGFPGMAKAHKVYIFQIKYGDKVKIVAEDGGYSLTLNGESLFDFENIEVYVTRFHIKDGLLTMIGVIKCLACNFTDDIKLKAEFIGEGGSTCEELPLKKSSLSLFASKTETSNFKMFVIKRKIDDISKIKFSTFLLGKEYDIRFTFPPTSPFSRALKRLSYVCDGVHVACKKNTIKISVRQILGQNKGVPATSCRQAFQSSGFRLHCSTTFRNGSAALPILHAKTKQPDKNFIYLSRQVLQELQKLPQSYSN